MSNWGGSARISQTGLLLWLAALVAPAVLAAQDPAPRDWSVTLRQDAQALHDDIAANHPGPVNRLDPGFRRRNDAQLGIALKRARDARTYADYFFALREYVSSFNDGHVSIGAFGNTPSDYRWPGFLTRYDARGRISVVFSDDPARLPVGARLLGCDGRSAEQYAKSTLGKMWGRWELASQRLNWGGLLFLDEGSRYIPHARTCRFAVQGRERKVALKWRPTAGKELRTLDRAALPPRLARDFQTRALDDGIRWYSIPSFDADPGTSAGKALPPMIAAMRAERLALAAAPGIVLDLRGNGGGSSDWSRQIAQALWGRAALAKLPLDRSYVEWRVSPANLDSIRRSYARQRQGAALSPEMRTWFETVISGLEAALGRGDRLWREPDEAPAREQISVREPPPPPLHGPVYILTDSSCASACLDAVDLWRALAAIHVGQTTSADTLYMDVRQLRLPSGIGAVSMPMKVYRGRRRGSNQPAVPTYAFPGDVADTPSVEQWIGTLRPQRRVR